MPNTYGDATKEIFRLFADLGEIVMTGKSSSLMLGWGQVQYPKDAEIEARKEQRKKFANALAYLKKSRCILLSEKPDGTYAAQLTEKGKRKIREFQIDDLGIAKPKKWDGVWRVVIFDIPNDERNARDALRNKLKLLGFYQLQKSVWVFPYPCQPEIEFLVELFQVYPFINILEARHINNDVFLREHFHLL
jgi:DNA-binding transcriptional regulator PaaX